MQKSQYFNLLKFKSSMMDFSFIPLKLPHAAQLHSWLQEPHVRAFWDDDDRTLAQVREHYFQMRSVDQFIILHQNKLIGYIQSCRIDERHELAKFCPKNKETYGIDLFIGDKDSIGKGLALGILQAFVIFLQGKHPLLQVALFDPSKDNPRAIHVFVKFGAKPIGMHKDKEILLKEV